MFEAEHLRKTYGERTVVGFLHRIMRGDPVGPIGPERRRQDHAVEPFGDVTPDGGSLVRTRRQRAGGIGRPAAGAILIPKRPCSRRSVRATTPSPSTTVSQNTRTATCATSSLVPERARSPVKALSGGERNWLLLARLFTRRRVNVLAADEQRTTSIRDAGTARRATRRVARARSCS